MKQRCEGPTDQQRHACTQRSGHGFTLVELLVVIGIIALLIAVLLPALNRAREKARQVQCLSNMKQLSNAVIMFAGEHKGFMPGRGGSGTLIWDTSGNRINTGFSTESWDWIAYQRAQDPFTGGSGGADQNITYSGLAKYLGIKTQVHTTPAEANAISDGRAASVFRCPSDDVQNRPTTPPAPPRTGSGLYRYSYSMNSNVGTRNGNPPVQKPTWFGTTPEPSPRGAGMRSWGDFTGKISSIRKSSEIILFVCEDEQTLDDGSFAAAPYNWGVGNVNAIATRHDLKFKRSNSAGQHENGTGNVSFCDGHAEFMSRVDALRAKHSGNPYPDPTTPPF
jgi:prepilin-type N-terminal cleavage/methylation domain-containing protein/prepilin-type processing-associated H-X9-DG protein